MALNYTSIQALINTHYMPVLYDNIFKKNHFITAMLKRKAKTFDDRKIHIPLEYARSSNVQATSEYEVLTLAPVDPFTGADYEPKMITGTLTISKEEELVMKSQEAVKNIITAKMNNLKKSIEYYFQTRFWARSTATKEWNSIEKLVDDDNTVTVGGITSTVPTWWLSKIVDVSGADYSNDPAVEDELMDPTKDVYLKKLLQRGIAKAKLQTGEKPDVIACPQYIWDLIEDILDPQKTGSKMNERAGSMGFTALDYRGIPIIADDDMVAAQTTDTDGRIWFLNLDYLYMFFNSGAKFTAGKFIEPANQNSRSSKVHAYGNLVIANRGAQCSMQNIRSPQSYAA